MTAIAMAYHEVPPAGHYWYDSRSGAWGIEGRETMGFILPGHDFGRFLPKRRKGNTGVFINGLEINVVEAAWIQRTLGAVYPGRWWLGGSTGYHDIERNSKPIGNIKAVLRA